MQVDTAVEGPGKGGLAGSQGRTDPAGRSHQRGSEPAVQLSLGPVKTQKLTIPKRGQSRVLGNLGVWTGSTRVI